MNSRVIEVKKLKALKEKLGVLEMIKFIQVYSNGQGDYTKESENVDITEEFLKYVKENGE